ncbi:hypothetical protein NUW58_g4555 [Xylaria curta]|uniref:Uncharacterized protein n=1 Tax=Xylaria curta TaxID=42375 RepID=A0ACC1P614_9PEZI|nr:hypothetical protein NUW58_g4555 [Xylaria curta]
MMDHGAHFLKLTSGLEKESGLILVPVVNLRVGTPEQDVRVTVSTASPASFVVLSNHGCSASVFESVPANCAVSRGKLFNPNESSSWRGLGIFGINEDGVGLEANLGYSQRAEFATEKLGLGLLGPSLENQAVAGIATAEPLYLGLFGLNNQPLNFTSLGNFSSSSFLATLKDKGVIPSLSWSYTAGAKYRLKQVYGQLVLSGYDTSRFVKNSVSFTMAGDVTRDLVVVLQYISYSGSSSATLLSEPIDIFIDSTDPNLWLPEDVCTSFEEAFGLTFDGASGLYLVNETQHSALLNSEAEVTFRLSDVRSGGDTVSIILPYTAFDLTAEYPLVENTSYYFPLKKAANSTQYTLGRTFLQEAYLSADYERGIFNISACSWVPGAEENVVTIPSTNSCYSLDACSYNSGSGSLSGGSIAGIVIGAVVAIIFIIAAIVYLLRRQRIKKAYAAHDPVTDMAVITGPVHNHNSTRTGKYFSPETIGTSTDAGGSEDSRGNNEGIDDHATSIVGERGRQELDGQDTQIRQTTVSSEEGSQSSQPHGAAKLLGGGPTPIYHELGGKEVAKGGPDTVSSLGGVPLRTGGEVGDDHIDSPFVSTIGSADDSSGRKIAEVDLARRRGIPPQLNTLRSFGNQERKKSKDIMYTSAENAAQTAGQETGSTQYCLLLAISRMRSRARSRTDKRRKSSPRGGFDYEQDFYVIVDELIWPAVRYADGPMRPHLKRDPMFTKFCNRVESFESLFKADRKPAPYYGASIGIPAFIRTYLHRQLERDLDWLDMQIRQSEHLILEFSLFNGDANMQGFKVGVVLSLVIHLLQLIPLYGPADGPNDGFYPGNLKGVSGDSDGPEYRSSRLVHQSIGNEPLFQWARKGGRPQCFFGVSHKLPGSMDQCWLNPDSERGSTPHAVIDPVYYGNAQDGGVHGDTDMNVEMYDSPEQLFCIFDSDAAASAILNPDAETDPAAHKGCLRMMQRRLRNPSPIAHSEMYKLQASREHEMARKWKNLCKRYWAGPRRASVISKVRSALRHVCNSIAMSLHPLNTAVEKDRSLLSPLSYDDDAVSLHSRSDQDTDSEDDKVLAAARNSRELRARDRMVLMDEDEMDQLVIDSRAQQERRRRGRRDLSLEGQG